MTRFNPCFLCLILVLALPVLAEPTVEEDWYVLLNGDDRIGYMQATAQIADNGDITTGQTVKLVMARAGTRMEIEIASSFVESAAGEPIQASSTMSMGGLPLVTEVEFGEKAMKVSSGQGGRMNTTMQRPIEGDWLPPAAMARYVKEQLAAGAETIQTRTVDVSSGLEPMELTMRVRGREDVEVYGKVVPAIAWDATVSAMPGVTMREYVTDEGKSIKSTIALMPGMEITVLQADKALALSELTPAEMMAQTFVVPSRPIERPRELVRGVYHLQTVDGKAFPDLPTTGAQVVLRNGNGAEVRVDQTNPQFHPDPGAEYLQSSPILNLKDPEVVEEFRRAKFGSTRIELGPGAGQATHYPDMSQYERAYALKHWVYRRVQTKDLSVGFATASDVVRTKQGDCTEHAVLLAALLRAEGIPSRCVSGLIYADQFVGHEGIFGYHMWTQAWLIPPGETRYRWVDLDATLLVPVAFDATHIALSVSDMNGGVAGNDMAALLPLMGNLEIEVVETVYAEE
ncbi:MAG: transglutaminase-like domain-containing protein [Planctomycetota bacterium]